MARPEERSGMAGRRVVPAWPMGMQTNSTAPQYCRKAATRGAYLAIFSSRLFVQPKSLQNPISIISSAHSSRRSGEDGGVGKSGIPLA